MQKATHYGVREITKKKDLNISGSPKMEKKKLVSKRKDEGRVPMPSPNPKQVK